MNEAANRAEHIDPALKAASAIRATARASRKRHLGYLYEMPLLVLILTVLSAILWPLVNGPWRLWLGVMTGVAVLLFLWHSRSR
ncbi:hypothetical protein [uncultured Thiodictyon sp.]|uniref:hypothetical protein n=1 Tax=uncultured Thiodictyon sp. TaxID=1846217 RepID=UPI0025DF20B2|nr:hypothetical protein [uncultured Thiodictyon sp.]